MENNTTAIARDNTIRVSPIKLANVTRLIVNLKASKAINQFLDEEMKLMNKQKKNLEELTPFKKTKLIPF